MANSDNRGNAVSFRDSPEWKFASRRRILSTVGAGSIGALAGCSGDDPDETEEDPGQDAGPEDRVFTRFTSRNPSRETFNRYNVDDTLYNTLNHGWTVENHTDQDHFPEILDDWWFETPTEPRIQLADEDFVWHDGDPVTIEDVHIGLTLNQYFGDRPHANAVVEEGYEIIDDRTIGMEIEFPMDPEAFWVPFFAYDVLHTKREQWVDVLERLRDATTDEAEAEVIQEMGERSFADDPVGNSPWMLDQASGSRATFVLNEDHPWADRFEYHTQELIHIPSESGIYERMLTENIDSGYGRMPATTLDQMPDAYELYYNHWWWGMGLAMHDDVFPGINVRKAMMYAIDHETVCANSGVPEDVLSPKPFQSGIIGDEERHQEIVGDLVDDYEDYEQDQDRAAELLEEAGYSKDDGTWYQPDGEVFEFTIKAPTIFGYYTPMCETVQTQLAEMGIETDLVVEESGPYYANTYAGGDHDMVASIAHGGRWSPVLNLTYHYTPEEAGSVRRDSGLPLENLPVPMPVGDPNGDVEEINIYEYLDMAERADEEEQMEGRRTLSWACNQHPAYYEQSEHFNVLGLHDDWIGPDEDSEWAGTQTDTEWHRNGIVEARDG